MSSGNLTRLAGIGVFSVCLIVMTRWRQQDETVRRDARGLDLRDDWALAFTYILMSGFAYWVYKVES